MPGMNYVYGAARARASLGLAKTAGIIFGRDEDPTIEGSTAQRKILGDVRAQSMPQGGRVITHTDPIAWGLLGNRVRGYSTQDAAAAAKNFSPEFIRAAWEFGNQMSKLPRESSGSAAHYAPAVGAARAQAPLGLAKTAGVMPALSEFTTPVLGTAALGAATGAAAAGEGRRAQGAMIGGTLGGVLGGGGKVLHSLYKAAPAAETAAALAEQAQAARAKTLAQAYRSPTEKNLAAHLGEDIYESDAVVRFNPAETFEQYLKRKAERDAVLNPKPAVVEAPPTPVPAPTPAATPAPSKELDELTQNILNKEHTHVL